MYWYTNVSESAQKKQSIDVDIAQDELTGSLANTVSDMDYYPFTITLKRGNATLQVYMTLTEFEAIVAQGLPLLQEVDRARIDRELQ